MAKKRTAPRAIWSRGPNRFRDHRCDARSSRNRTDLIERIEPVSAYAGQPHDLRAEARRLDHSPAFVTRRWAIDRELFLRILPVTSPALPTNGLVASVLEASEISFFRRSGLFQIERQRESLQRTVEHTLYPEKYGRDLDAPRTISGRDVVNAPAQTAPFKREKDRGRY